MIRYYVGYWAHLKITRLNVCIYYMDKTLQEILKITLLTKLEDLKYATNINGCRGTQIL